MGCGKKKFKNTPLVNNPVFGSQNMFVFFERQNEKLLLMNQASITLL
jgi:hypothetical protein